MVTAGAASVITGAAVLEAAQHMSATAAGPDGWRPVELRHMPGNTAEWLVALYRGAEAGAPWPAPMLDGKAACVLKRDTDQSDPPSCRVLVILSAVYRRWAQLRLRSLNDWVAAW